MSFVNGKRRKTDMSTIIASLTDLDSEVDEYSTSSSPVLTRRACRNHRPFTEQARSLNIRPVIHKVG